MPKLHLLLLGILLSVAANAQHALSEGRRESKFTYAYRINAVEMLRLFAKTPDTLPASYLHNLVDSFPRDAQNQAKLPPGNYILLYAAGGLIHYEIETRGDLDCKIIGYQRQLSFVLSRKDGSLVQDAAAFIRKRSARFDPATQSYRVRHHGRSSVLKVYDKDVLYLFTVDRRKGQTHWLQRWWPNWLRRQEHRRWVQHPSFHYGTSYEKKYAGFLVFNKPIYKPGDTVFIKAWIAHKNGRPVNRPLLLRLSNEDFVPDSIITTVYPYRPGGYTAQFVIKDSLDIDLDEDYLVTLEELSGKKINVDDYDGDLDEDEYAAKRKVLVRGKFRFEEYDLHQLHLSVRSDRQKHQRGEPMSIFAKATDENDLPILDGRLSVVITPEQSFAARFDGARVFLADTLWRYEAPLDPIGETRITLPDSIFPDAGFRYRAAVRLNNSNNENREYDLSLEFGNQSYQLFFSTAGDSISVTEHSAGKQVADSGLLTILERNDDTISSQPIAIPLTWKRNTMAATYSITTSHAQENYTERSWPFPITCMASRTNDSVFIRSVNDQRHYFWYSILAGQKEIQRGYTQSLVYADKAVSNRVYTVRFRMMLQGEVKTKDYGIPYRPKMLNLQVSQPAFIYPGKTQEMEVQVTDNKGRPVNGADITAFGSTAKFEKKKIMPYIPYFGKLHYKPVASPFFNSRAAEAMTMQDTLRWDRWAKAMGLDTAEYFRFLHPDPLHQYIEPSTERITQLAPFLVKNGFLQPIYYLYIDEQPCYFSQATQTLVYSFHVYPGRHSLRFRTAKQLVSVDSIQVLPWYKNFISLSPDSVAMPGVHLQDMPDTLTTAEQSQWSSYMLQIENDFGETPASIEQYHSRYLINPPGGNNSNGYNKIVTAGPFLSGEATLTVNGQFKQRFETEGNFKYVIKPGLVKMKQPAIPQSYYFKYLHGTEQQLNLGDQVLTENSIAQLWQDYLIERNASQKLFETPSLGAKGNGSMHLELDDADKKIADAQQLLLFRYDDPDFVYVCNGYRRDLGYLSPGCYRLMVLFRNEGYGLQDSLCVRPGGINFFRIDSMQVFEPDSVSLHIIAVLNSRELKRTWSNVAQDLNTVKESFNDKYLPLSGFRKRVSGTVVDEKGQRISAVAVVVRGTRYGTLTDANGRFSILVPENSTLVFSSVGYDRNEVQLNGREHVEVQLKPHSAALSEVVVTGYGTVAKRDLTASIVTVDGLTLAGKVSGKTIRGISTQFAGASPLVIVDGLPYSGGIAALDSSQIASIEVLTGNAATSLYGSMAANGVVIVTSKSGRQGQPVDVPASEAHFIRRHFRDDAYWHPQERTDVNGIAHFRVKFPDDITKWNTAVIAVTDKGQTGSQEGSINAFKQTSATMSIPHFLIQGDTAGIIAKVQHYSNDSLVLTRRFAVSGGDTIRNQIQVMRNAVDTFKVTTSSTDSLEMLYVISDTNGDLDGEQKRLPVFLRGTTETTGYFAALQNDSTVHFNMGQGTAPVQLHAEVSLQPVLLEEVERVQRYRYLCNEQIASKLKTLLLKLDLLNSMHHRFQQEKNIRELIARLQQTQSGTGLWSWWPDGQPSLWITLHVWEALQRAAAAGYPNTIDKTAAVSYLMYHLPVYTAGEQLTSLQILQVLGAKPEYNTWLDSIYHKKSSLSVYQHLQLLVLKQSLGMPVPIDSLLALQRHTRFGNAYWGQPAPQLFNNDIEQTELVYRLLKANGGHEKLQQSIRNFFFEKRSVNGWNNTWESCRILESIVPDIVATHENVAPQLLINDSLLVDQFPFNPSFTSVNDFRLVQKGNAPVYLSLSRTGFEPAPQQVSKGFIVNSSFQQSGNEVAVLKAGVNATLSVDVNVLEDASLVMIEVPIPAGCYYGVKQQTWTNNEVHRSYENGRVEIFCQTLNRGHHLFTVELQPRFTGRYFLNPAKASLMYFPVFYGQEAEKKVTIR